MSKKLGIILCTMLFALCSLTAQSIGGLKSKTITSADITKMSEAIDEGDFSFLDDLFKNADIVYIDLNEMLESNPSMHSLSSLVFCLTKKQNEKALTESALTKLKNDDKGILFISLDIGYLLKLILSSTLMGSNADERAQVEEFFAKASDIVVFLYGSTNPIIAELVKEQFADDDD